MTPQPQHPALRDRPGRTPGELLRAARRLQRLQMTSGSPSTPERPWLLPMLFVPGIGATRLRLMESRAWTQQDSHGPDLWDPDETGVQAALYGWMAEPRDAATGDLRARELAERWQLPAQVLHEHEEAAHVRFMARILGIDIAAEPIPALRAHLLGGYDALRERGWTALMHAYWPLADALAPRGDPLLASSTHAHVWDWRGSAADAAPGLAARVLNLLDHDAAHGSVPRWRWPARRCIVIVAENSGVDLVRAALPMLPERSVLAVYTVDDPAQGSPAWFAALAHHGEADEPRRRAGDAVLSRGWDEWQRVLHGHRGARLAINGVLPGPLGLLNVRDARPRMRAAPHASVLEDPWQMPAAARTQGPPTSVPWIACNRPASTELDLHLEPDADGSEDVPRWQFAESPELETAAATADPDIRGKTMTALGDAIARDLGQRLLREPATPFSQPWTPLGLRTLTGLGTGASTEATAASIRACHPVHDTNSAP